MPRAKQKREESKHTQLLKEIAKCQRLTGFIIMQGTATLLVMRRSRFVQGWKTARGLRTFQTRREKLFS